MILDPTRTSTCANGATWSALDATTQVLVVNTKTVVYDEAIDCCTDNLGQLIKIDTAIKSYELLKFLEGVCILVLFFSKNVENK